VSGLGYQLTEAANGREAIEKLDSVKPDLVLLDIALPDIDGWSDSPHQRKPTL